MRIKPNWIIGSSSLWVVDKEVKILSMMAKPNLVHIQGLLSDQECDALINLAAPNLKRSLTIDSDGKTEEHAARTSSGMFFNRGQNSLVQKLEMRIASLFGQPIENGEGLQVLRYLPGAEYKPHFDYFNGDSPALSRGGNRIGTVLIYLNTVAQGGGTTFPDAGLTISAVKGNAVFFGYDLPLPDTLSLHGGDPVVQGEKWVATKWLRERTFV